MKIFCFKGKYLLTVLGGVCAVTMLCAIGLRSSRSREVTLQLPSAPKGFEINDTMLIKCLHDILGGNSLFENLNAHISSDGTLSISADASPDGLTDFMASRGTQLPPTMKFMLRLLPGKVRTQASLRVAIDAATGSITLTPDTLSVNRTELSCELLPTSLVHSLEDAVNTALVEKHGKIDSIELNDGKIIVTF